MHDMFVYLDSYGRRIGHPILLTWTWSKIVVGCSVVHRHHREISQLRDKIGVGKDWAICSPESGILYVLKTWGYFQEKWVTHWLPFEVKQINSKTIWHYFGK